MPLLKKRRRREKERRKQSTFLTALLIRTHLLIPNQNHPNQTLNPLPLLSPLPPLPLPLSPPPPSLPPSSSPPPPPLVAPPLPPPRPLRPCAPPTWPASSWEE